MAFTTPKTWERVLLVEGQDDLHVVGHICTVDASDFSFDIISKDNWEKLRDSISVEIKAPGRQVVGILADADDIPTSRWDSVKNQLGRAGIEIAGSSFPQGLIVDQTPKVGVWLMPDNEHPHELEDFVIEMIPDGDVVWPRSRSYIDSIPEGDRPFTEGKKQRAQLYAWLATREEPHRMGTAIKTHDLDIDGPLCQKFVAWLRQLFQ